MYKILITGGNGFIGGSLVNYLGEEFIVDAPPKSELDLLNGEKVYQYIYKTKPDAIIHCATYDAAPKFSTKDKNKVLENNLRMYYNLAKCSGMVYRMFYFGSGAEFCIDNMLPKAHEYEFGRDIPMSPYAFSKYIMNIETSKSPNIYNLRLFSVFGPGEDWRYRTISNLCVKKIHDMPLKVPEDRLRDWLYINDLCRIVRLFLGDIEISHHSYNVCSGDIRSNQEIAKMLGGDFETGLQKRAEYSGNIQRLKCLFPEFKFTPFEEALRETLYYYTDLGYKYDLKGLVY